MHQMVVSFEEMRSVLMYDLQGGGLGTVCGVPLRIRYPAMGSILSEVLCAVVAGHFECLLDDRAEELRSLHLIPPLSVHPPSHWVQSRGHVDDLVSFSRVLCPTCINKVQQYLIPQEIGYGIKDSGTQFRAMNTTVMISGDDIWTVP